MAPAGRWGISVEGNNYIDHNYAGASLGDLCEGSGESGYRGWPVGTMGPWAYGLWASAVRVNGLNRMEWPMAYSIWAYGIIYAL